MIAYHQVSRPVSPQPFTVLNRTATGMPGLMSDAMQWGDVLFLSGRADVDPASGHVRGAEFRGQAERVLHDVASVLTAAGSGIEHVLRVECWLKHAHDFGAWNELWQATFAPPRPARTTLVADFAVDGLLIEVQITAGIPA